MRVVEGIAALELPDAMSPKSDCSDVLQPDGGVSLRREDIARACAASNPAPERLPRSSGYLHESAPGRWLRSVSCADHPRSPAVRLVYSFKIESSSMCRRRRSS